MRSNGQSFHRCLPAEFQIVDEHVASIRFVLNQSSANWILADVSKFLGQTFIMTQAMIEEISLPLYARQFCRDPFVIEIGRASCRETVYIYQVMKMLKQKQQMIHIQTRELVII